MSVLRKFDYLEPSSLDQAVQALAQHDGSLLLAGGTDLLVKMRGGKLAPSKLISLSGVPGLTSIGYDGDLLKIRAMVTHGDLEGSELIRRDFPLLADAAQAIGSMQVRNVATIGGNLCNAAPSADLATPLLALDATVGVVGPGGKRVVALENFFAGPSRTILEKGEIMTEVRVPKLPSGNGGVFIKHAVRRAMELALLSVSVIVVLDQESGICNDARIAMGVVAPVPMRARIAESLLKGKKPDIRLAEQAGLSAAAEAQPRSSFRASAEYRREMLKVLVRRGVNTAVERALSAR